MTKYEYLSKRQIVCEHFARIYSRKGDPSLCEFYESAGLGFRVRKESMTQEEARMEEENPDLLEHLNAQMKFVADIESE